MLEYRGAEPGAELGDDVEDARLSWIVAMKSLARSRGVSLEVVLRAAERGDLGMVVELPASVSGRCDDGIDSCEGVGGHGHR